MNNLHKIAGVSVGKLNKAKDMIISGNKHRGKFGRLNLEGRDRRSYLRKEIKDKNFGAHAKKLIGRNSERTKKSIKEGNTGLTEAYNKEHTRLADIAKKG